MNKINLKVKNENENPFNFVSKFVYEPNGKIRESYDLTGINCLLDYIQVKEKT